MQRAFFLPAVALAVTALVAAGCGSSSKTSSAGGPSSTGASTTSSGPYGSVTSAGSAAPAGRGATVAVSRISLGRVLVDAQGRTLYLFMKDRGGRSSCTGACTSTWAPLATSGAPRAGAGVAHGKLRTTRRPDGTTQVTYNGHPLYTFTGDSAPGQATGEGSRAFGAEWYTVSPIGNKWEKPGS
jgi:predicted lipoprotein with Yx(FWY)xxD motif